MCNCSNFGDKNKERTIVYDAYNNTAHKRRQNVSLEKRTYAKDSVLAMLRIRGILECQNRKFKGFLSVSKHPTRLPILPRNLVCRPRHWIKHMVKRCHLEEWWESVLVQPPA